MGLALWFVVLFWALLLKSNQADVTNFVAVFKPGIDACESERDFDYVSKIKKVLASKLDVPDPEWCDFACVYKKMDIIDSEGKFVEETDFDRITHDIKRFELIKTMYITCLTVNAEPVSDEKEGCHRTKLMFECMKENTGNSSTKFGME